MNVYTPGGQKLGAYDVEPMLSSGQIVLSVGSTSNDQYFGGRRLAVLDELGSAGTGSRPGGAYFPWGESRGTQPTDNWNSATYWQDSVTGLDYAMNRYYSNTYGRFMTPDPYTNSGRLNDPQSWNRYAYTRGDPVNRLDPGGSDDCAPGDPLPCSTTVNGSDDDYWDYSSSINPGTYMSCLSDPACYSSHQQAQAQGGALPNGMTLAQLAADGTALANAIAGAEDRLDSVKCAGLFLAQGSNTAANRTALWQMLQSASDSGNIRIFPTAP